MLITTINPFPTKPSKALYEELFKEGTTSADRKYICQHSFALFFSYYFLHYLKYKLDNFQWEMLDDYQDLANNKMRELGHIMFRESAKTTMANAYVCYLICYSKKKYINVDSYDKGNAESFLFDVTTELQSNISIIRDFGELYNEARSTNADKTKKRVTDFITSNKIRVEAHSTQEPVRGRKYGAFRPDFLIADDIETLAAALPNNLSTARSSISSPSGVEVPWALM